jgi:uncharacterized membrane protein
MPSSDREPRIARPRVHVLDFIRLMAMLLMIQGHTLDAFVDPAHMNLDTFHWQTWVQLRGLTAPLFLLVSGAATVLGIRYEKDGRVSRALLRHRLIMALTVIGIGYLLVFPANCIADLRWVSRDVWRNFLQVNILQLNGVTLLLLTSVLAFTKTVRRYAAWSLGLGFLILLASPFVTSVDWFRILPEGPAAFLSFDHGSLFPLFPAGGYMFLGVGLGALLLETPEAVKVRWFRLASLTASVAFLLVAIAAKHISMDLLPAHDAYKAGYSYTCFRLGFALLIFGSLAWIVEAFPKSTAALAPMGRKSLYVYVGHITLIYGTPWTVGLVTARFHALSVAQGALFIPLVGGITFGAILLWDWIKKRSIYMGTLIHASAVLALACALVF